MGTLTLPHQRFEFRFIGTRVRHRWKSVALIGDVWYGVHGAGTTTHIEASCRRNVRATI
tara:strand:+ start:259 stop:435 length:177 start_codon:yes stop_codon:yes gene_type:complete